MSPSDFDITKEKERAGERKAAAARCERCAVEVMNAGTEQQLRIAKTVTKSDDGDG
jgi:hypothetical protein